MANEQAEEVDNAPLVALSIPTGGQRSASITKLATALAKAQSEITFAKIDATNPYYSSTYATLASVLDAVRGPLTKNGLSVVQLPGRDGDLITLETMLCHESGEFIGSTCGCPPRARRKDGTVVTEEGPQGMGKVITYLRRYALAAIVGIAQADTDGNMGSDATRDKSKASKAEPKAKVLSDDQLNELRAHIEAAVGCRPGAGAESKEAGEFAAEICEAYDIQYIGDLPAAKFALCKQRIKKFVENNTEVTA